MFATLLGSLPRPPLPDDADPEELLVAAIRAQVDAGLEPITDGGFGIGATVPDRWRLTASLTDRPVKQSLLGPYSAGQANGSFMGSGMGDDIADQTEATLAAVDPLRDDLLALVAGGCPLIEIHEPAATGIGTDDERALFREAHRRLLDGVSGTHLSLAITGGNADRAGAETLLAAPYASLAIDLVAGPDNWRLVVVAPGARGIVCGALSAKPGSDDRPELLLWAAGYAASTGGRGRDRVGLATASSLAHLTWDGAMRKIRVLGEAVRLADLPPRERRLQLDPRAVDIRSAALGRHDPRPPSTPRRPSRRKRCSNG